MPDLDVRITSMYPPGVQGGIRAYASATIAGCFAVRGIKIVEGGKDGLFMSMPSRKTQDGYKDICFPVTEEFRNELKQAVLGAYGEALSMAQACFPVSVLLETWKRSILWGVFWQQPMCRNRWYAITVLLIKKYAI